MPPCIILNSTATLVDAIHVALPRIDRREEGLYAIAHPGYAFAGEKFVVIEQFRKEVVQFVQDAKSVGGLKNHWIESHLRFLYVGNFRPVLVADPSPLASKIEGLNAVR
jgi:hypothetical protein